MYSTVTILQGYLHCAQFCTCTVTVSIACLCCYYTGTVTDWQDYLQTNLLSKCQNDTVTFM